MSLLSNEEIEIGVRLCRRNAERYYEDAKILFENKSYGHSYMLGTLCLEELGKYFLLVSLKDGFFAQPDYVWKTIFRDHTFKNLFATLVLLGVPNLPKHLSNFRMKLISVIGAIGVEKVRQWSQYVDYVRGWRSPFDKVFKKQAKNMLLALPIFLNIERVSREERLKRIQEALRDPKKIREIEALSSVIPPLMKRSLKRFGNLPKIKR